MTKQPSQAEEKSGATAARASEPVPTRVRLVPYPKVVFLYPTFAMCLLAAILVYYQQPIHSTVNRMAEAVLHRPVLGPEDVSVVTSIVFLYVLAVNLVVLAFDFPRATSLTLLFAFAALALALTLAFTLHPEWLPQAMAALASIRPHADATFYACAALIIGVIFVGVFISVRFNYWEVTRNELLHHHGILSDLKRFPTQNLRVDKEINDVFEYMLMGSGRLILQPSGTRRAIVLDNVPFISKKESQITSMLRALEVELRTDPLDQD